MIDSQMISQLFFFKVNNRKRNVADIKDGSSHTTSLEVTGGIGMSVFLYSHSFISDQNRHLMIKLPNHLVPCSEVMEPSTPFLLISVRSELRNMIPNMVTYHHVESMEFSSLISHARRDEP